MALPTGDPELPGVNELPATGVAVAGNVEGRGVGLGVGRGVGLGVGRGVGTGVGGGVGAATITGVEKVWLGLLPVLVTALKVTVHVPAGRADVPAQVPLSGVPPATSDNATVLFVEPVDAVALTLSARSVRLPM
jgi:hypothetical protein